MKTKMKKVVSFTVLVVLSVIGVGIALSLKRFNQSFTVGSAELNCPRFASSLEGLRVDVVLSSSSVKTGETLQMRVNLTGPKAWNVNLARFTVANSHGEKVYDVYIWLPHRTLDTGEDPPQDYVFYLEWEAKRNPTAGKVEVSPGLYSFALAFEVEGKELNVRGTIEVK